MERVNSFAVHYDCVIDLYVFTDGYAGAGTTVRLLRIHNKLKRDLVVLKEGHPPSGQV